MTADSCPALVLNADFRPLSTLPLSLVSWQQAVIDVLARRVIVVAEYDAIVRSPSTQIRLPSVVALKKYQTRARKVAFTRFNVFLRDRFTCQYCGVTKGAAELTFDHVVPRSRGGATSWENIVTACGPCNMGKGSRTALRPCRLPMEPTLRELLIARRAFPRNHLHESWLDYVYWDSELER
jgi:5-methylcytosine-specific restriction endonuclease McrA